MWAAAWLCAADVAGGTAPASSPACGDGATYWDRAGVSNGDVELSWDNM